MKFHLIFLFLFTCAAMTCAAGLTTNQLAQARAQGSNALASLKGEIRPATAAGMGFSSTNEAQGAVLGEQFCIYKISKAQLLAYIPGQLLNTMLAAEDRVIYPALVNGVPKSTIIVALVSGSWRTDKFGDPALIEGLSAVRQEIAATNAVLANQTFAVEVSIPNFWFLGYTNAANSVELRATSNLKLGPISKGPHELLDVGLMQQLTKVAQRYGGLAN
jgi:hypothetical protein